MLKQDGPHKEANTVKIKEEIIFLSITDISNVSHSSFNFHSPLLIHYIRSTRIPNFISHI